ncbi:MAG: UTP--glucose-1-phosphate uridylyltransferase [Clostridia bacterium]|nr:UTP--glucose-1-phosphate uridylyltransferase [Clostridia bacterium]
MKKITKAVIPVAGFGTRFLPFTKSVPKMMLPVIDKPVLQIIVEEAVASGIEEILFVVGKHSGIIENYFSPDPELVSRLSSPSKAEYRSAVEKVPSLAKFSYVVQKEQKGTAHAVSLAKEFTAGEPFLLMFGDDLMYNPEKPVSLQLMEVYDKTGKTVIGSKRVPFEEVPKYASIEYDFSEGNVYNITSITEKPPIERVKSNLSPLGRYVCAPDIYDFIEKTGVGANGEYQITDAYDLQAKAGRAVACEFEGIRYDTGDKLGYLKAVVEYSARDSEHGKDFIRYLKEFLKDF